MSLHWEYANQLRSLQLSSDKEKQIIFGVTSERKPTTIRFISKTPIGLNDRNNGIVFSAFDPDTGDNILLNGKRSFGVDLVNGNQGKTPKPVVMVITRKGMRFFSCYFNYSRPGTSETADFT